MNRSPQSIIYSILSTFVPGIKFGPAGPLSTSFNVYYLHCDHFHVFAVTVLTSPYGLSAILPLYQGLRIALMTVWCQINILVRCPISKFIIFQLYNVLQTNNLF